MATGVLDVGTDLGSGAPVTPDDDVAKILLVDDRPENLMALEAILSGLGHELVTAQSGEEALKRLLDRQEPGWRGATKSR